MPSKHSLMVTVLLFAISSSASAQSNSSESKESEEKTRVGTCEDARSQMEYFCEEKEKNSNDMMIGFNACSNAQKNVKEACEGIVEADVEYKFDKKE